MKTCYDRYKRSGERHVLKRTIDDGELSISSDSLQSPERVKRPKIGTNIELKDKPCIVCNQVKFKGINKRFRICEDEPPKTY